MTMAAPVPAEPPAPAPAAPTENRDAYRAAFERRRKVARDPAWLAAARDAAMARFTELGFPTVQDEDWRFTNVAPVARLPFRPNLESGANVPVPEAMDPLPFAGLRANRLVFVDGHFAPGLSSIRPQPGGVRIASLRDLLATEPTLVEQHLHRQTGPAANAFLALNTAFFQDGACVLVPPDTVVPDPLLLLFLSTGEEEGSAAHVRNLIVAERGSRLTVIESYISLTDAAVVTNTLTELVVGDEARVEHLKWQEENPRSFHVAHLAARFGRASQVIVHSFALGARLSRTGIQALLAGPDLECVFNGLYLTKGDQLADHHMVVEHAQPHCASHEYFNGILDDQSKGVFHGRILVQPAAQKTDAKQTNKNLLLSDAATVDTKPQLEIYADDVKCTHGATVGQMDEDSIFYLRSRGIGLETARQMLMHAFAGEIIDRVRCEAVREELDRRVWQRLEQQPHLAALK
jgi:Fe-S cluster assembly protein SufD